MRRLFILIVLAMAVLASGIIGVAQNKRRINPMVALHEQGLPVFGVTHPAITGAQRPAESASPAALPR